MRVLVLGAGGMLGRATLDAARARGWEPLGRSRTELDLRESRAIEQVLDDTDGVINCAAFTRVDDCEDHEELATEVNGHAVGRLAEACAERHLPLVHVSTDYVFPGDATRPYNEDDEVGPRSAYGRSKAVGEKKALAAGARVVRASWLFGPGGNNFVTTMLGLADRGEALRVVDDQRGCPTYTPFLAEALTHVLSSPQAPPLLHYANPPAVTWFGFARAVFEVFGRDVEVTPCTTADFPRPAPRPAYSVLATRRFESIVRGEIPTWRSGLEDYRQRLAADGRPGGQ